MKTRVVVRMKPLPGIDAKVGLVVVGWGGGGLACKETHSLLWHFKYHDKIIRKDHQLLRMHLIPGMWIPMRTPIYLHLKGGERSFELGTGEAHLASKWISTGGGKRARGV